MKKHTVAVTIPQVGKRNINILLTETGENLNSCCGLGLKCYCAPKFKAIFQRKNSDKEHTFLVCSKHANSFTFSVFKPVLLRFEPMGLEDYWKHNLLDAA